MSQLLIILLICILTLKMLFAQNLQQTFKTTDIFFDNLAKKYEFIELSDKIKMSIDKEIDQYLKTVSKQFQVYSKRTFHKSNIQLPDTGILNNLEMLDLNISNVKDIHFFLKYNKDAQRFAVILTSSKLIVCQIFEDILLPITYYSVINAFRVHAIQLYENFLFITQNSQNINVFYFFTGDESFIIKEIKKFNIPDIKDLSFCYIENQLFMGISTSSAIYIYFYLENDFKLTQILPCSVKFTTAFKIEGSSFLATSDKHTTIIFKYLFKKRLFVPDQIIRKSFDGATIVQLKNEYLLALTNSQVTILYKRTELGAFLPFQELLSADRAISVIKDNTVFLLLLKNGIVDTYYYDGWRFVRLNFQLNGVKLLKNIVTDDNTYLLIKKTDESWSLNRLDWMKIKESKNFYEEMKHWCVDAQNKAKQMPKIIPKGKDPVRISKAQIKNATVKSINDISLQKLQNLRDRYRLMVDRLVVVNGSLSQAMQVESQQFVNLRARSVRVNCKNHCTVNNLITKMKCNISSNLRKIDNQTQNLKLEHVKVDTLNGFPCPKVGIAFDEVNVKGLINGISFDDLQKNVLRTSGDQVVTAEHVFNELHVESLNAPNFDLASSYTRQKIKMDSVHANELNLTDGGLLLPLDGEPVTMTGTLIAARVKFNKRMDLHGGLKGKNIKRLSPMIEFPGNHYLKGNYTLGNVNVTELLSASDIIRRGGKSLKEIVEKAIPLNGNMPVLVNLSKNNTLWTNVTVENLPNWLTRKNAQMVKVTGKKIALKSITLPDSIYSKLPVPKIRARVCSVKAITPNIKTSTIRVGQANANFVTAKNIYGAKELEDIMNDSVTYLDEVDLSEKNFTGFVYAENMNISNFKNNPFYSFEQTKLKWYRPDLIEGSVKVKNLKVNSLTALKGLKIPFPSKIENMIVEGNLQVKTINGINIDDFFNNIVLLNDTQHMKNVIFEGSVEVDEIEAAYTNINLQNLEDNVYLGDKIIYGDLEIEDNLSVQNLLSYPSENEVTTYVVDGSVNFESEPIVENINGENVQKLIFELWMLNRPVNLTGKFTMKNVTFANFSDSYELLNTPDFGSWKSLENRLLSKTKLQEIQVPVNFRKAKFPNILTGKNSTLHSSDQYFNDLLFNTIKINETQIIRDNWRLDKLIVKDNIELFGKINNLNLSSDVARHDIEKNIITGIKIVDELTVRNLEGLKFGEWTKDVLMQDYSDELIIVKGKKIFNAINARTVNVTGTVMGKKLENCLKKTGNQVIVAPKIVDGSLQSNSLIVKGLINDVNLTDFMNNKLKRNKTNQIIKSKMLFKGNLRIMGNLTVKGMSKNFESFKTISSNETLSSLESTIDYLKPFAVGIKNTVMHRAKFWIKFEEVKDNNILINHTVLPSVNNSFNFPKLGNCSLINLTELLCTKQTLLLKTFTNAADILVNQLLNVSDIPIVIQINSGPRSRITIHTYDSVANIFYTTSMRASGITEASISKIDDIVWIVTHLKSAMMIFRYEPWVDFRKYHLPESRFFVLDRVLATNELVLIRDDGMWKLEGLAGPRHTFKVQLEADKAETFTFKEEFYVRLLSYEKNKIKLLRAICVGI